MLHPCVRALTVGITIAVCRPLRVSAQVDPEVRNRIIPAAVQIAIVAEVTVREAMASQYLPIGSGTVISPDGLTHTNWHVVDMVAWQQQLAAWEAQATARGETLQVNYMPASWL